MALREKIVFTTAMLMLASGIGVAQRVDRQTGEAINGVDFSVDQKVRVRGIDAEPVDAPRSGNQSQPGQRASHAVSKWGPARAQRAQLADDPRQPVSAFKGRPVEGPLVSGAPDASDAGKHLAARATTRGIPKGKTSFASPSISGWTSTAQQPQGPSVHNRGALSRGQGSGFPGTEKHARLRARERSAQQNSPSRKGLGGPKKRASGKTGSDHKTGVSEQRLPD